MTTANHFQHGRRLPATVASTTRPCGLTSTVVPGPSHRSRAPAALPPNPTQPHTHTAPRPLSPPTTHTHTHTAPRPLSPPIRPNHTHRGTSPGTGRHPHRDEDDH